MEQLWSPEILLKSLWLDATEPTSITASGGLVSQWSDKSGNGKHGTQATTGYKPSYANNWTNGLGAVTFDGVDDFIATTLLPNFATAFSVFIVFEKLGTTSRGGAIVSFSQYYASTTSKFPFSVFLTNSLSTGQAVLDSGNGDYVTDITHNFTISGPTIIGVHNDPASGSFISINGVESGVLSGVSLSNSALGFTLGRAAAEYSGGIGLSAWNGKIAEVFVVPYLLPLSDRQNSEGYLSHKLAVPLVSSHPYALIPPRFDSYVVPRTVWGDNDRKPAHLWTMDNVSGATIYDEVNNGLNLTTTGDRVPIAGWDGNCLSGGTVGNTCKLAADTSFKAISMRIKRRDLSLYSIIGIGNGGLKSLSISTNSSGTPNTLYAWNGSAVYSNLVIADTNWHHLMIVEGSDNNNHWLYVDGGKSSTEINTQLAGLWQYFGRGDYAAGQENVHIDNIQWYNFIPTDKEIAFLASATNQRRTLHVIGDIETDDMVEPYVWLESDDATYRTIATGVSKWWNKVGGGCHAVQATAANQPVVTTNIGIEVFSFDGSNDRMTISGFPNNIPVVVIAVYNHYDTGGVTYSRVVSSGPSATSDYLGNGVLLIADYTVGGTPIVERNVFTERYASAKDFTTLVIGDCNYPVNGANCKMYLCAVLILPIISEDKIARIESYLASKYIYTDILPGWHQYKESPFLLNDIKYSKSVKHDNINPWRDQYKRNDSSITDITGWSLHANSFPTSLADGSILVTNKYAFHFGGNDGTNPVSTTYRAAIADDGSIGAFSAQTGYQIPTAMWSFGAPLLIKNRVYLLNGNNNGSPSNVIMFNNINEDGTIGAWTSNSLFPVSIMQTAKFVIGNKVYVAGGYTTANQDTIYSATVPDGVLMGGTFSLEANRLPEAAVCRNGVIITSSKVYIPFYNATGTHMFVCNKNDDGLVGAWSVQTISNSFRIDLFAVIVTKNRVFLLGGYDRTNNTTINTTLSAPIDSNGNIGTFVSGTNLYSHKSHLGASSFVTSSKIFLLCGYNTSNTYSNTMFEASFPGIDNNSLDKTYSYTIVRTDDILSLIIKSTLRQLYNLRDFNKSSLRQKYDITRAIKNSIRQIYSLILGSSLRQDMPFTSQLKSTLTELYDSCYKLKSTLKQEYSQCDSVKSTLRQDVQLSLPLYNKLRQIFDISNGPVKNTLSGLYDIMTRDPVKSTLHQLYNITGDGSNRSQVTIAKVKGINIRVISIDMEFSIDQYCGSLVIQTDFNGWSVCNSSDPINVIFDNNELNFVVTRKLKDIEHGSLVYTIEGKSPSVLLDLPYCKPKDYSINTVSSLACSDIAGSHIDWYVGSDEVINEELSGINGETPIQAIKKIANEYRAKLQTRPDGSMFIIPSYRYNPDQYKDNYVSEIRDSTIESFSSSDEDRPGYNVFYISSKRELNGYDLRTEQISDNVYEAMAYKVPWSSKEVYLLTSELTNIKIVPKGITTRDIKEEVEIKNGEGKLNKPCYGIVSYSYGSRVNIGSPSFKEDGVINTAIVGSSIIDMTYTTKFWLWEVIDTDNEKAQLILVS